MILAGKGRHFPGSPLKNIHIRLVHVYFVPGVPLCKKLILLAGLNIQDLHVLF